MRIIYNTCTDPYFNLSSEEFLLENTTTDVFMVWRNEKSVIIGKNQNAYGEADLEFCKKNDIKLVRRLTGGGAVFHDPGNINFSFVTDARDDGEIDFLPFINKITDVLFELGVKASANGRNDIEAAGCKISGNAQCVHNCKDGRRRLLHHGTLLFSADMSSLAEALMPDREKIESKGIKSVKSRVINIADIAEYKGPDSPEEFCRLLCQRLGDGSTDSLTDDEIKCIERLREEKYSRWEWNFGESPHFLTVKKKRFPYGTVEVSFSARKGIIEKIKINGDFFALYDISELEKRLIGASLQAEKLQGALSDVGKYIHGAETAEIIKLITEV